MLDEACSRYGIDLALLNVVANDFAESVYGQGRKDSWTLRESAGGFVPVAPQPASNLGIKLLLLNSALSRYLVVNQRAPQKFQFVRNLFYGDVRGFEENVERSDLDLFADRRKLDQLLRELLRRYRRAARGAELRIVLDANRQQIYAGDEEATSATRRLFAAAKQAAGEAGVPVLDLTFPFREDWGRNQKRFEFAHDGHWNAHAHGVVAGALGDWLVP